jgi:hypothetical protein
MTDTTTAPASSWLDRLKSLAGLVAKIGSLGPLGASAADLPGEISLVKDLLPGLKQVVTDLETVPKNADGTDTTLEQAAAHFATSQADGHGMAQRLRDQADAALNDNKAEDTKPAGS